MTIRRMFAGSIVAMLFSAFSLGAACELSCGLAQLQSDCHSHGASKTSSGSASLKTASMDMAMDGMGMPDMATSDGRPSVSPIPASTGSSHPSIGEMGPCERQSCDGGSAASTRSTHISVFQSHLALAAADISSIEGLPPAFHDARDDISPHLLRDASPLSVSLRI